MKEIELISKRKANEKHFLQSDGSIKIKLFKKPIHFFKNGRFEDIDNTLIKDGDKYINKNNSFKFEFNKNNCLYCITKDDNYMNINLSNHSIDSKKISVDEKNSVIVIKNILNNVDLKYSLESNKIKEYIILKNNKINLDSFIFEIETNFDLENVNNQIMISDKNQLCFLIEKPFMIDSNNRINDLIKYVLIKKDSNKYILKLELDNYWLVDDNIKYPVIIDPTITNANSSNSVQDTYIFQGDANQNDVGYRDILKVGVERDNNNDIINRSLIKFDLPVIGTGSQIIDAKLRLTGFPTYLGIYDSEIIDVHRVTQDWDEATAKWNNMNNKFDSRIESWFDSYRSWSDGNNIVELNQCYADITNLVKKWYEDTPNYGLMLKANKETYQTSIYPAFFSKDNLVNNINPKPVIEITYRNQNGLEEYMNYYKQVMSNIDMYINSYNGNLTGIFDLPFDNCDLKPNIVYNTNDVILNNNKIALGMKLNYYQTIKSVSIDNNDYLEFEDEDGTLHYFKESKEVINDEGEIVLFQDEDTYYDEDGLELRIVDYQSYYKMIDNKENVRIFTIISGIGYLTKIESIENNVDNSIYIEYTNGKITRIYNSVSEINISYSDNSIIISLGNQSITLTLSNNKLINITYNCGQTSIAYDNNNVISQIIDSLGMKLFYEYMSKTPYRIKKVTSYGLNNELGQEYNFEYGYSSTTLIDNNDVAITYTFNNYGNICSESSLKSSENLEGGYGFSKDYGEFCQEKNKTKSYGKPIKYVKNYISNSYFENNLIPFIKSNSNSLLEISADYSFVGDKSLKYVCNSLGDYIYMEQVLNKNKYYTFSAYVKSSQPFCISMYYYDNTNEIIEKSLNISPITDEFERYDLNIFYPNESTSNLYIRIENLDYNPIYIDCIQLEEGKVANNHNLLDNSDFHNGLIGWDRNINDENLNVDDFIQAVNIGNNITAIKVIMNPEVFTDFGKTFNISGRRGDIYSVSFWYKNKGIISDNDRVYNNFIISFDYSENNEYGHEVFPSKILNPNDEEWQFYTEKFIAEDDYDGFSLNFFQESNANELYITNITVQKDINNHVYLYDEDGKIIDIYNPDDSITNITYLGGKINSYGDENQKSFFEYDSISNSVLKKTYDKNSLTDSMEHDSQGNQTSLITNKIKKSFGNSEENYRIRIYGENKYLYIKGKNVISSNCKNLCECWNLDSVTVTETEISIIEYENELGELVNQEVTNQVDKTYYKIHNSIINNRFFKKSDDSLFLGSYNADDSLFELKANDDGSFYIIEKSSKKYLQFDSELCFVTNSSNKCKFYFEKPISTCFYETNAFFENKNRPKYTNDELLNKVTFNYDSNKRLNLVTLPNNCHINYKYDSQTGLLDEIESGDRHINYIYSNQLLNEIDVNGKKYDIMYDSFCNVKKVKINNTELINILRDNTIDKITRKTYGNGDIIQFDYDEFLRYSKITKGNDEYEYLYNSDGNLAKILNQTQNYSYNYDFFKRLSKYSFNDFLIRYSYGVQNTLNNVLYKVPTKEINITYEYNDIYDLNEIKFHNNSIKYNYDTLERINSINYNDTYFINYKYMQNGKRTSFLVSELNDSIDKLEYRYDSLKNITHIIKNNSLIKKYYYDSFNELIKEINYDKGYYIKYKYDVYGNIISASKYSLDHSFVERKEYKYNNSSWQDLLTNVDGVDIVYDQIGNPIQIGNNIYLTWDNGRELKQINNGTTTVSYEYDVTGIRISKTVNNNKTEYYYENNNLICEKNGNNTIFYIYDVNNNILGFKYNNDIYYYRKNAQDDIIGILDANFIELVKYDYDSWGNILSITDSSGNDVSNNTNNIGNINPIRYKSYYFDKETGLYYLISRYYNPIWKRFINADNYFSKEYGVTGFNMFAYCDNNPINNSDPDGHFGLVGWIIVGCVTLVGATAVVINTKIQNKKNRDEKIEKVQEKKDSPEAAELINNTFKENAEYMKEKTKNVKGIKKLKVFKSEVAQDKPMDIKKQEPWYKKSYMYNGTVLEAQDIGNMNYGYIGRAIGIPTSVLIAGAGINQMGHGERKNVLWCFTPSLCDDPRDTYYIKYGAELYDSGVLE